MENHRCKLCSINFANGRALGGHMRSHMMYLNTAPKHEKEKIPQTPCFSPSPSSSSSSEQSETEPSMSSSKRARKSRVFYPRAWLDTDNDHTEETSSVSDTTAEEDVAYCLMMLSRDSWQETGEINTKNQDMEKKNTKFRGKYRCETCGRVFKSYQALGGHRASHGRIKAAETGGPAVAEVAAGRSHECPFCDRVFASGQALGGHKRSHFVGESVILANVCPPKQFSGIGGGLEIDLNLPPQDEDEISQVAVSAVSDAEFFQEI